MGLGDDPHVIVDLAVEAEQCGWDGVFIWDTPYGSVEDPEVRKTSDAWVLLSAIAMRTERAVLGTEITPLAWHRPWLITRQAATLDHLSRGRFILCTGLGSVPEQGIPFPEETDRKTRAAMLDEALDILVGLWSGEPFVYEGAHFKLSEITFTPRPYSGPRVPIWVVGAWPRDASMWPKKKSMRRTLRFEGLLPNVFGADGNVIQESMTLEDLRAMARFVAEEREPNGPFEIVYEGNTDKLDSEAATKHVQEHADAGATWWLEEVWREMYRHPGDPRPIRDRLAKGPPLSL